MTLACKLDKGERTAICNQRQLTLTLTLALTLTQASVPSSASVTTSYYGCFPLTTASRDRALKLIAALRNLQVKG